MTPWQRQMLNEAIDRALTWPQMYRSTMQQVAYDWNSMIVIDPRILRELLDLTEERTVEKASS